MRPREERRSVIISSRMRFDVNWRDARILNLSTRGAGLSATAPPDAGTYIEIRRGAHVLVARVVWVNGLRFGVQTQDPIPVQCLIHDPEQDGPPAQTKSLQLPTERRGPSRSLTWDEDRSRAIGRSLEFAFLVLLIISAACIGFGLVRQVFGHPLETVQQAMQR